MKNVADLSFEELKLLKQEQQDAISEAARSLSPNEEVSLQVRWSQMIQSHPELFKIKAGRRRYTEQ